MDRSLFEPKPSVWYRIFSIIGGTIVWFMVIVVPSVFIGVSIGYASFWWKNTEFVDKLDYKWALEKQYNNGKYNEKFCLIWEKNKDSNQIQRDFCKAHNNYKDHPKSIGDY